MTREEIAEYVESKVDRDSNGFLSEDLPEEVIPDYIEQSIDELVDDIANASKEAESEFSVRIYSQHI